MTSQLFCHLLCMLLYLEGIRCWRISGRMQGERAVGTSDTLSANIQSRAAGTFLWARPPVSSEDFSSDPVRIIDPDRRISLIRQCTQTLARPGLYKIRSFSSANSQSSPSFCYVMVKAPALHRIRFSLRQVNVNCRSSGLMLFDGWQLVNRKRSITDVIPAIDGSQSEQTGDDRKLYLCSDNVEMYRSLETSQNIGQLMYVLRSGEEVLIQIDFLPDNQVCNTYIGRDDQPMSVDLRVDRPQNCRIYISGASRLRFSSVALDNAVEDSNGNSATCGSATTNFVSVQANSSTWNPSSTRRRFYHCDTDLSDFNTPCRFNVIELHTITYAMQSAVLTIDPLPDVDREPWSYYCY